MLIEWILCVFQIFTIVRGLSLTTTPSKNIIIAGPNRTPELTVKCRPESSVQVFEIIIGKRDSFGKSKELATVDLGALKPVLDISIQTRATVSGSLSGSSAFLEFKLKGPGCSDVDSTLYCTSTWQGGEVGEETRNLTSVSYPKNIQMEVNPDKSVYDSFTQVEFTCSGNIGNQDINNVWHWEWRINDPHGQVTSWMPYPDNANITIEKPTKLANCQYRGVTVLVHHVTKSNNYREIRCYAVRPEYGGNNRKVVKMEFASNNTVTTEGNKCVRSMFTTCGCASGLHAGYCTVYFMLFYIMQLYSY